MCLYSLRKKPYIAHEDIVCYKLLKFKDKKIYSPYANKLVCNSNQIIGYVQRPRELFCKPIKGVLGYYMFQNGVVHSCQSMTDVRFSVLINDDTRIFKCIIPKGTKYWEGLDNDFCSKKLKYLEDITIKLTRKNFRKRKPKLLKKLHN